MINIPLSEISTINPRFRNEENLSDDSLVSFVPMAFVSEKTKRIINEEERPFHAVKKGFTYFRRDDILIAKITPCFENGKVAIADIKNKVGFGSTEFHVIRPEKKRLDTRYLFHFISRQEIRFRGEKRMIGSAGQKRVPLNFLETLLIPLPTLDEQKRIARFLDKADALRKKRRLALQKLAVFLRSVFLDMFVNAIKSSGDWPQAAIGEVAEIVSGSTPKTNRAEYWNGDINWIAPSDLSNVDTVYINETSRTLTKQGLDSCSAKILPPNSVLFSSRAPIGHLGINTVPMCTNQGFKSMIPDIKRLDPRYLYFWLLINKTLLQNLGNGATFKEVSKTAVERIVIPVPPLKLQEQFGEIVDFVEKFRRTSRNHFEASNSFFRVVQSRAFKS